MRRLRSLSEAECYARCYGQRTDEAVRVVRMEPRTRTVPRLAGEELRRLFEERLEAREAETEAA